jgi:signal transduction histidine kinase/ActR/RegA family two-component response regulator
LGADWVEPSAELTDVGDRQRARLLATLLLVLIALGLLSACVQLALVPGFLSTFLLVLGAVAVLGLAYAASRTARYRVGGLIASLTPIGASVGVAIDNPHDHAWYSFMLIGVLLGSIFLATRLAAVIAAATFVIVCLVVVALPELHDVAHFVPPVMFHATFSPLLILAAHHRSKVEIARRAELRASVAQLAEARRLETVGRLAGGVAHDFNNLLTVMFIAESSLRRKLGDDPRLDEIKQVSARAAELTRQLLAFARRQVLEPRALDPRSVLADIEGLLSRLIGEHIALEIVRPATVGAVLADPSQLEQVIVNLSINARDAMPDGGTLTIELADVELDEAHARQRAGVEPGAYVAVSVSDTGAGMDDDTCSRVFEPFFTTKEGSHGTGLGLATVHGIVMQSGGHIDVSSELGRGTVFRVYLPRADEPAAEAASPSSPGEVGQRTGTILLVEDDEPVRRVTADALVEAGYDVLVADSGERALEICAENGDGIQLLVTDVVMSGIGGGEVAARLRDRVPHLEVLFISGYSEDAVARQGFADEGAHFLPKPFTVDGLTRKVAEVMKSSPSPQTGARITGSGR